MLIIWQRAASFSFTVFQLIPVRNGSYSGAKMENIIHFPPRTSRESIRRNFSVIQYFRGHNDGRGAHVENKSCTKQEPTQEQACLVGLVLRPDANLSRNSRRLSDSSVILADDFIEYLPPGCRGELPALLVALARAEREPAGHETPRPCRGETAPPPGGAAERRRGQLTRMERRGRRDADKQHRGG